jgi:hypothetical protein
MTGKTIMSTASRTGGKTPETTPFNSVYPNPGRFRKSSQSNHGYELMRPVIEDRALMNATGKVQRTISPPVIA